MLTLFAAPKPFRGHAEVIQRNAIRSWVQVDPSLQIILFGDEYGTREAAREHALEHVPAIGRSPQGTPLVDHLFRAALERAAHPLLCYVNSDILLLSDFRQAARMVRAVERGRVLLIGQCRELEVVEPLDFTAGDGEQRLLDERKARGAPRGPLAMDYFLFTAGLFDHLPPFVVGRARYDNWLVWKALRSGALVIDATAFVHAIHQKHDYAHLRSGKRESHRGLEARRNRKLAGVWRSTFHVFSVLDAPYRLTPEGIRKRSIRGALLRQFWVRLGLYLKERLDIAAGFLPQRRTGLRHGPCAYFGYDNTEPVEVADHRKPMSLEEP